MFWQDVAVKVFSKQEYSEDVIQAFRQEVDTHPQLQLPYSLWQEDMQLIP